MSHSLIRNDRWASRSARFSDLFNARAVRRIAAEIRAKGVAGTLRYAVLQLRYSLCIALGRRWDRRWGTDTGGQIRISQLSVVGPNKAVGGDAVSTSPKTFKFLSRYFPKNLHDLAYVDIGAGKGRTLLMASRLGFKSAVGVEFSGDLCAIAAENVCRFRASGAEMAPCSIVHADALAYELPEGDQVIYLAAFGLELWPAMIEKLVQSYRRSPRSITVVAAGSRTETIAGAGHLLSQTGEFVRVAGGRAPYYLDTYLPFYYECFRSRAQADEDSTGTPFRR